MVTLTSEMTANDIGSITDQDLKTRPMAHCEACLCCDIGDKPKPARSATHGDSTRSQCSSPSEPGLTRESATTLINRISNTVNTSNVRIWSG